MTGGGSDRGSEEGDERERKTEKENEMLRVRGREKWEGEE